MPAQTYPVVQFTRLADWLADLDAGVAIGVWHALPDRPGFVKRAHTIVRAIVAEEGQGRIAALAFEHNLLFVDVGRPAGDETQARHSEIGVLPSMFRAGVLDLPGNPALIYAAHPLDDLTEELAAVPSGAA